MNTVQNVVDFPVTPLAPSSADAGLFASYEIKPPKRPATVLAGYGILATLVLLLVVVPLLMPQAVPNFLQNRASAVDLVLVHEPPPPAEKAPVVKVVPPPKIAEPKVAEIAPPPVKIAPPVLPKIAVVPPPPTPKQSFQPQVAAVPTPVVKPVHTGAFADPNISQAQNKVNIRTGAFADPNVNAPVLAKANTHGPALGSFGTPAAGSSVSTAHNVATGAFGTPAITETSRPNGGKNIATGTFGGSNRGSQPVGQPSKAVKAVDFNTSAQVAKASPATAAKEMPVSPVQVISKPAPTYTEEARRLKIQGDVTVQVIFSASGQVQIVRVVKGLGHGLDEAATYAARQIRFSPAKRDGQAVDYPATIHIVFALS